MSYSNNQVNIYDLIKIKDLNKIKKIFKEYNVDWSSIKQGTKVVVFHEYEFKWKARYFSSYIEENKYAPFKVNFTTEDEFTCYPPVVDDRRYGICFIVEE